jgi:ketosteroid isomerase-like protein
MFSRKIPAVSAAFGLCVGIMGIGDAMAAESVAAKSRAEIERVLAAVEQGFARAEDATTLSKRLYADDVVMVGEGATLASRGMKAAIQDVQEWYDSLGPNGMKTCKYTIADPVVASSTTFSSFMLLHCAANPPKLPDGQDLRMMYIWKKGPKGWRVALEMYAPGKF